MQNIDLEQFPNTSGWHIEHERDSQMYFIKSEKGRRMTGRWTTRIFAEKYLFNYLASVHADEARKQAKTKK
jgi:hypothetical protein